MSMFLARGGKGMKRSRPIQILSVVMSFLIVIGILTISKESVLAASDSATGLLYNIWNDKAVISGFSAPAGFGGDLIIPEMLGGVGVATIDSDAFNGCTSLKTVSIPQTVINIYSYAFANCTNLTALNVHVSNTAFKSSDGVLYTKDGKTLIFCPLAKSGSVTIPSGTATIKEDAFDGCSKVTGISIPASVTTIGYDAFKKCSSLTSISIPAGVTGIGAWAFDDCSNLSSIIVDPSNTVYKSVDGVLYSKNGADVIRCPEGKSGSCTISYGATNIKGYAFRECLKLTDVTIPNSVTVIRNDSFMGCSGLTGVVIPASVTSIEEASFDGCYNLTMYSVDGSNTVYKSIDGILYSKDGTVLVSCPQGKSGSITIPNGVTSIGEFGFGCCPYIRNVSLPNSVTSIGDSAFAMCWNLTNITIPSGVKSIEDNTFWGCYSLVSVTIPSGVTSIGIRAFEECAKLASVSIPNSVKTIGSYAFERCSGLTGITIPVSVTSIGSYAFSTCTSLKDAYFYGNAPTMGSTVFSGCAAGFTVHYLSTSTGYTNPWNGYTTVAFTAAAGVTYQTHVQDIGWQDYVVNGATSGTSGQSKRLEAIRIKLNGISGGIEYKTHVQDIGWQDWVQDDALSGTSGQSKRLEAIRIRLTGEAANIYDVYYRVHAQNVGWMDWAKNGESSGTAGFSYRLEAIEVVLVKKGDPAPGATAVPFVGPSTPEPIGDTVSYKTHVQDIGWMDYVSNGDTSGTSGQSKRMEAIQIKLQNMAGGIEYRTHVQDYGWMNWVSNDALSGTSGESKRLEAIEIRLTGEAADKYDVYYRVHAQNFGWLDWAVNGGSAGTAGYSYRLEAIEIVLVPKGYPAPGPTDTAFMQA